MAFFSSNNNQLHFFGVFYFADGDGKFSGSFHEMSPKSAARLSLAYQIATTVLATMFFAELIIFYLSTFNLITWGETAIVGFIGVGVITVLSLASLVITQKRIKFQMKLATLNIYQSAFVYIFIILASLDYSILMIWISRIDSKASGLFFWIFMFFSIMIAALVRLLIVSRYSGNKTAIDFHE